MAANFFTYLQSTNYRFNRYRETGTILTPSDINSDQHRNIWENLPVPDLDNAQIIFSPEAPRVDEYRKARTTARVDGQTSIPLDTPRHRRLHRARLRFMQFRDWFSQQQIEKQEPLWQMQRVLGSGTFGLAVHYRDAAGRDVVIKYDLNPNSDSITRECINLDEVRQSAHCIRKLRPDVGRYRKRHRRDDSSATEHSSGNESLSRAELRELGKDISERHLRRNRSRMTQEQMMELLRKTRERNIAIDQHNSLEDNEERWIALEYMEHGSLSDLIEKLTDDLLYRRTQNDNEGGRVPNRVLWSFWLCRHASYLVVRACIAMEYPPRKFHPHRRIPLPEDIVTEESAIDRRMRRATREIDIPIYGPGDYEIMLDEVHDLNESIPKGNRVYKRRNFVHFDIDPQNVLIGGLELNTAEHLKWHEFQEARRDKLEEENSPNPAPPIKVIKAPPERFLKNIKDRIRHEHILVPRLKLADFGVGDRVKLQKRNHYYLCRRMCGKWKYMAPEQFGADWNATPGDADGPELAEAPVAGNYGPHTNVWGIAMTMWSLITKFEPICPPYPEIPDDIYNQIPENMTSREAVNAEIRRLEPELSSVSYCTWNFPLQDNFEWVDKDLRDTIYDCLYHAPDDRPTLSELLKVAEHKVRLGRSLMRESDETVMAWVHKWFYEPYQFRMLDNNNNNNNNNNDSNNNDDDDDNGSGGGSGRNISNNNNSRRGFSGLTTTDDNNGSNGIGNGGLGTSNGNIGSGFRGLTTTDDNNGSNGTGNGGLGTSNDNTGSYFNGFTTTDDNTGSGFSGLTTTDDNNGSNGTGNGGLGTSNDNIGSGFSGLTTTDDNTGSYFSGFTTTDDNTGSGFSGLTTTDDNNRSNGIGNGGLGTSNDNIGSGFSGLTTTDDNNGSLEGSRSGDDNSNVNLPNIPPAQPHWVAPGSGLVEGTAPLIPPGDNAPSGQQLFDDTFPNGFDVVRNRAIISHCGVTAIVDSLLHQLPGIDHPTPNDLLRVYRQLYNRGAFNLILDDEEAQGVKPEDGPWQADILITVLHRWGESQALNLQLYLQDENGNIFTNRVPTEIYAQPIFICNRTANHWEGMKYKNQPLVKRG